MNRFIFLSLTAMLSASAYARTCPELSGKYDCLPRTLVYTKGTTIKAEKSGNYVQYVAYYVDGKAGQISKIYNTEYTTIHKTFNLMGTTTATCVGDNLFTSTIWDYRGELRQEHEKIYKDGDSVIVEITSIREHGNPESQLVTCVPVK